MMGFGIQDVQNLKRTDNTDEFFFSGENWLKYGQILNGYLNENLGPY